MNSIESNYIHRHDMFYESYNMEEFDPFNTSWRLVIIKPPKFLINYIGDCIFNSFLSEGVRDIIQNRYIL